MAEWVEVPSSGGHSLSVYLARPQGAPRGGVVVLQEIFGVNRYIRSVVQKYADLGYLAVAPSIFDRFERRFQSAYGPEYVGAALELRKKVTDEDALADMKASLSLLAGLPTAAVGFCFGGYLAWLAAARLRGLTAAVGYYPTGIGGEEALAFEPRCRVMLHFGEQDRMLPPPTVEAVRAAHPDQQLFVYDADHGFDCPDRPVYSAEASALAQSRTSAFLDVLLR